jgi:diguanylate cyclase (GGDEF)-like protein
MFTILINITFGTFFKNFILQQENHQIDLATNSLSNYLNEQLAKGLGNVNDWGHWNDTYDFIQTQNEEYIQNNLGEDTFENLDINFIILVNQDHQILFQQYYSFEEEEFIPFPADFGNMDDRIALFGFVEDTSSIMKIGENYYFVNSSGVTDSQKINPAAGIIVTGRAFDRSIIENIETVTGCQFCSISALEDNGTISAGEATVEKTYSDSKDFVCLSLAIINERQMQDSVQISLDMPRTIYLSSMKSALNFGIVNTILCLAITAVVFIALTFFLTRPFEMLLRDVRAIDTTREKFQKIAEKGSKEFLYLRGSINQLLTRIEETQEKITNMALYDQLTGIPNKAYLNDLLQRDISLASRIGKIIGVVFIDLDDFKSVNDTRGHDVGDDLLRQVAQRLSGSVRKHDTVARFGGDEFLMILNNMSNITDLEKKVQKIMDIFNKPFDLHGTEYFITCSAGVSVYPADGEDAGSLVKNADIAMYHSKNSGKGTCSFSSRLMKEDLTERIELTNYLYRALEHNELEVYYQPLISIGARKIVGFEALLRWNHPQKGLLLPEKFIHLAEHTRLINPIGKWVLETVCKQMKAWHDMNLDSVRIAVNMSVVQFLDPNLLDIVKDVILETGVNPKSLELEITESIATNKSLNIEPILRSLKEIGVLIAIDDFGTEYSSLARLKTLSIDRLKMDMQFVQSISKSEKDDAVAKIIIQLAKNLNLNITAEGIETETQMKFLSANACDEMQGFYYYKPMRVKDAEKLLLEQKIK